jgi:hypothetical protein
MIEKHGFAAAPRRVNDGRLSNTTSSEEDCE